MSLQDILNKLKSGEITIEEAQRQINLLNLQEGDIDGDVVEIQEAAVNEKGLTLVKLIQPGQGSSGYYTVEALKKAADQRIFHKGMQMFMNHQTAAEEQARPEGDLERLMGTLQEDAKWMDNGPKGPGLYSLARIYDKFKGFLNERYKDIGVSIRAMGKFRMGEMEGRTTRVVEELTRGRSVDFVTRAGAGGSLVPLFESFRQGTGSGTSRTDKGEKKVMEMDEKEVQRLRESAARTEALENEKKLNALREAAREAFKNLTKNVKLSIAGLFRVEKDVLAAVPEKDGKLDEAAFKTLVDARVTEEIEYLKESGVPASGVRNMGEGDKNTDKGGDGAVNLEEAQKRLEKAQERFTGRKATK